MTAAATSQPRDFWLLWGASTASNLGDGIRVVALPLLAVSITTDPLAVSAVTAASFGPWLLFSLFGGAVADRLDRRRLILVGQVTRAVLVAGFAVMVATGSAGLPAIYLIAVAIGVGEVVVDSALPAALPQVANDLDTANSRISSAQFLTNEVLGGPLGGALFAIGASVAFFVDAATFAVGAVLVALITRPLQSADESAARSDSTLRADIAEGLRFLLGDRLLFGIVVAAATGNLAVIMANVMVVLLVIDLLGASSVTFGVVLGAAAVGGFTGSMAAARLVRAIGRRPTLIGAFAALAAGIGLTAVAPEPVTVAAAGFATTGAVGVFNVASQTVRQKLTPDRLMGRVVASGRVLVFGAVPVGSLGGGLVARWAGVRPTIGLAAAIAVATMVLTIRVTAGRDLEFSAT